MRNDELVDKLLILAGGDLDLLQLAIRSAASGGKSADLENVVRLIAERRKAVVAGSQR